MAPTGFEHAIPTTERPQNHTLDHVATGIGIFSIKPHYLAYLTTLSVAEII